MTNPQPVMSVSLDLDNQWSYMKTHGDPGWQTFPSYLDELVDIVLDRLAAHGLRITFFIVGQDAALAGNAAALGRIARAGHEVGNHSFHHEPWLHLRSLTELDEELARAERAIEAVTGRRPRGFRGPGFSLSAATLSVLSRRGYQYDASTLPTFLGPLARAYYFSTSRHLSPEERKARARLFGTFQEGLRPLDPYLWDVDGRDLLEIPVTTIPIVRVPFHLSYLLYLAGYSRTVALTYLRLALRLCLVTRTQPSFLLHPLDFLGGDRVSQLAFFPGMQLRTDFKVRFFDDVMALITRHFRPVTMEEHAALACAALPMARTPQRRVYAA